MVAGLGVPIFRVFTVAHRNNKYCTQKQHCKNPVNFTVKDLENGCQAYGIVRNFLTFNYQKADDKMFVCKFKKKMLSPGFIILRIQRLEGKQCR